MQYGYGLLGGKYNAVLCERFEGSWKKEMSVISALSIVMVSNSEANAIQHTLLIFLIRGQGQHARLEKNGHVTCHSIMIDCAIYTEMPGFLEASRNPCQGKVL